LKESVLEMELISKSCIFFGQFFLFKDDLYAST